MSVNDALRDHIYETGWLSDVGEQLHHAQRTSRTLNTVEQFGFLNRCFRSAFSFVKEKAG